MTLARLLTRLADLCRRRAVPVLLAGLALAALCAAISATRLGVTTDTDALFDPTLPWRQAQRAEAMPQDYAGRVSAASLRRA